MGLGCFSGSAALRLICCVGLGFWIGCFPLLGLGLESSLSNLLLFASMATAIRSPLLLVGGALPCTLVWLTESMHQGGFSGEKTRWARETFATRA